MPFNHPVFDSVKAYVKRNTAVSDPKTMAGPVDEFRAGWDAAIESFSANGNEGLCQPYQDAAAEAHANAKRTYIIGEATYARVFRAYHLNNVHDLQTVLNAVEKALTGSQELRDLRRWHWNGAMHNRTAQRYYEEKAEKPSTYQARFERAAQRRGRTADFHMRAVQALNDFFPVGDNAENDRDPEN